MPQVPLRHGPEVDLALTHLKSQQAGPLPPTIHHCRCHTAATIQWAPLMGAYVLALSLDDHGLPALASLELLRCIGGR